MKLTLQVLLHVLGGLFGYWLATPAEDATAISEVVQATAEKRSSARTLASMSIEAASSAPATPPPMRSEMGLAVLVPVNGVDFSDAPLTELPALLRGIQRNRFLELRIRLIRQLFERWASLDLPGALAALRGITSPQLKERAMWAVLDRWTQTEPEAAWAWTGTLDDDSVLQEAAIEHLLYLSAAKDPLGSAAMAAQIEDVFLREKALTSIGDSWMSKDPQGALAALTTVEPKRLRDYLMGRVCHRDGVDHAAGLEIVSQLPTRGERAVFYEEWLGAYVNDKPQEAFEWLRAHAEQPDLQMAADTVGCQLGATLNDSSKLYTMAQQLPAGPIRDAFTARAVEQWTLAGGSLTEAQELLTLCGPCVERDNAQSTIDSKRTEP